VGRDVRHRQQRGQSVPTAFAHVPSTSSSVSADLFQRHVAEKTPSAVSSRGNRSGKTHNCLNHVGYVLAGLDAAMWPDMP